MGCNCKKKQGRRWNVISASGSVLYSTDKQSTAEAVKRRHKGSRIEQRDTK